jgi:hypothetical protein
MEEVWRKEREAWHRQKEDLKVHGHLISLSDVVCSALLKIITYQSHSWQAWAQSQGRSQDSEASPRVGIASQLILCN